MEVTHFIVIKLLFFITFEHRAEHDNVFSCAQPASVDSYDVITSRRRLFVKRAYVSGRRARTGGNTSTRARERQVVYARFQTFHGGRPTVPTDDIIFGARELGERQRHRVVTVGEYAQLRGAAPRRSPPAPSTARTVLPSAWPPS